jgi:hypothetical protein
VSRAPALSPSEYRALLRAPESAPPKKGRTRPVAARGAGDGEVDGPGLPSPPAGSQAPPRARKASGADTSSTTKPPKWWKDARPEAHATSVAVPSPDAAERLFYAERIAPVLREGRERFGRRFIANLHETS